MVNYDKNKNNNNYYYFYHDSNNLQGHDHFKFT